MACEEIPFSIAASAAGAIENQQKLEIERISMSSSDQYSNFLPDDDDRNLEGDDSDEIGQEQTYSMPMLKIEPMTPHTQTLEEHQQYTLLKSPKQPPQGAHNKNMAIEESLPYLPEASFTGNIQDVTPILMDMKDSAGESTNIQHLHRDILAVASISTPSPGTISVVQIEKQSNNRLEEI